MNRSLVETYYYGHNEWPSPFSPAGVTLYDQPNRERQMINIARQQLAVQESARKDIIKSNIAGAQIIACEMQRQTQTLESAIQDMGKQVTDSIGASADQIISAIEELGQALCMELSEIRWQLVQQNETLDKILEVLSENRSNEARQLVRQGARLYLNEDYIGAEEVFHEALRYDRTDYQVLMNLAFLGLHKNDANEAFSYFKKALSLPENLDAASKARNLWATARLFYSQKDFAQAEAYAEKALQYEQEAKEEGLFKLGVYQVLAGHMAKAMKSLNEAVAMNPEFFGRCAVEPDLLAFKDRIIPMLSEAAEWALNELQKIKLEVNELLSKIEADKPKDALVTSWMDKVNQHLNILDEGLKSSSYLFLVIWRTNLYQFKELLQELSTLSYYCKEKESVQKKVDEARDCVKATCDVSERVSSIMPNWIWPLVYYIIPLVSIISLPSKISGVALYAITWPIVGPIFFIGYLLDTPGFGTVVGGIFTGILIDACIMYFRHMMKESDETSLQSQRDEQNDRREKLSKANSALYTIEDSIRKKNEQMSKIYGSIKSAA